MKVDRETMTQNDIDLGILSIVVGLAPLKPAEFVIITIRQQLEAAASHLGDRLTPLLVPFNGNKLRPVATWSDIGLPEADVHPLRRVADEVQCTGRGPGNSALLAGESGTGTAAAAEVLASHLGLDLYRIDLRAVGSKYIGETGNNLGRLFDAAEGTVAILYLDEADALFGKRTNVRDSRDRYANAEISYLLQRIESYQGLVILATTRKSALDEAFTRRLHFVIDFPFARGTQRDSGSSRRRCARAGEPSARQPRANVLSRNARRLAGRAFRHPRPRGRGR